MNLNGETIRNVEIFLLNLVFKIFTNHSFEFNGKKQGTENRSLGHT